MADKENGFLLIPKEILQDRRLNPAQKMVFAYVSSFGSGYGCCIQSNDGISEKINIPPHTVSRAIAYLSQIGYVDVENPNGRNRRITPQPQQNGKDDYSQPSQIGMEPQQNGKQPSQIVPLPSQNGSQRIQLEDIEKTKENIMFFFSEKFQKEEMTTEQQNILLKAITLAKERGRSDVEGAFRSHIERCSSAAAFHAGNERAVNRG